MAERGQQIRFVKGTYAGLTGWINKLKKKSKGSTNTPVIVQLDEDTVKATWVKRASYRDPFTKPTSKEEAAVQQHPDLELAMINLAAMWAQVGRVDKMKVAQLFLKEFEVAETLQKQLKSKARFRYVEYSAAKRRNPTLEEDLMIE